MGTLSVDQWAVEFDDRLLAHLQIVIVNRFRRGEPILVSWIDSRTVGGGRSSIWLTPTVPAYFRFSGSRTPSVNLDWLHRLDVSASASTGLVVTDEAGEIYRAGGRGSMPHVPRPTLVRESVH